MMNNVFCVSTTFHLLVVQSVAYQQRKRGDKNFLILWRAVGRKQEIFTQDLSSFQQLLIEEIWDGVLLAENISVIYDLNTIWPIKGFAHFARAISDVKAAEREINGFLRSIGEVGAAYICNFTAGPIDRHVLTFARKNNVPVNYIEDGVATYITSSLKNEIDRFYWTSHHRSVSTKVKIWLTLGGRNIVLRIAGLDHFALSQAETSEQEKLFNDVIVLYPDKYTQSNYTGKLVCLKDFIVPQIISTLENCIPWSDIGSSGLREGEYATMYLSRPDSEDGLIERQDEVELVSKFLNQLVALHGRLLLKPHPRDSREKIQEFVRRAPGVAVFNTGHPFPVELLAQKLKLKVCYGSWTGSLLYLNQLFNIDTYSILPLLIDDLRERGRDVQKYQRLYSQIRRIFPKEIKWVDRQNWSDISQL